MTKRHDNWRSIGSVLADVMRATEFQGSSVDPRPVKDGERHGLGRAARPSQTGEESVATLGNSGKSRTPRKRPAKSNREVVIRQTQGPQAALDTAYASHMRSALRVVVDNGRGEPIAKPSKRGSPRLVAIGSPLALRAVH